jgi:WD40 repeat protein
MPEHTEPTTSLVFKASKRAVREIRRTLWVTALVVPIGLFLFLGADVDVVFWETPTGLILALACPLPLALLLIAAAYYLPDRHWSRTLHLFSDRLEQRAPLVTERFAYQDATEFIINELPSGETYSLQLKGKKQSLLLYTFEDMDRLGREILNRLGPATAVRRKQTRLEWRRHSYLLLPATIILLLLIFLVVEANIQRPFFPLLFFLLIALDFLLFKPITSTQGKDDRKLKSLFTGIIIVGASLLWDVGLMKREPFWTHPCGIVQKHLRQSGCRRSFSSKGAVAFSSDGKRLIYPYFQSIRIDPVDGWHLPWSTNRLRYEITSNEVIFSPDGTLLVSAVYGSNRLYVWHIEKHIIVLEIAPVKVLYEIRNRVAFSPDGRVLAIANRQDQTVQFLDTTSWQSIGALPSSGIIAFSPDGEQVAVVNNRGNDKQIELWRWLPADLAQTIPFDQASRVESLTFAPDGTRLAATTGDGSVYVWQVASGLLEWNAFFFMRDDPEFTNMGSRVKIIFSPDSQLILVAYERWQGEGSNSMTVWTAAGERLSTIHLGTGRDYRPESLAISPDCRLLAVGLSREAQIYDLKRLLNGRTICRNG